MGPQHIAKGQPSVRPIAALRPQHISLARYPYLFAAQSSNLRSRRIRTDVGQAGSIGPVSNENKNWRNRCPRASNHCWRSAWLRLSRPVQTLRLWKNMSLSIPSPSRSNLHTLVSTSNLVAKSCGQAFGPVRPLNREHYATSIQGGAA